MESLEKSSNAIPHVIIDCQNGPEGNVLNNLGNGQGFI